MRLLVVALAVLAAQLPPARPSRPQPAPETPASITVFVQEEGSGLPLEGVTVIISPATLPKRAFKATTFSNGGVRFDELAPGRYTIIATSPGLVATSSVWGFLSTDSSSKTIVLNPGENRTVTFPVTRPCTISGQVLTEAGKPLKSVAVEVGMSTSIRGRLSTSAGPSAVTDGDGLFAITKLPPGRYFVRARVPPTGDASFNVVYAPGTTDIREATVVVLASGEEQKIGITARLVPTVAVTGRVVDAQQQGLPDVALTLRPLDESAGVVVMSDGRVQAPIQPEPSSPVRTNAEGRFTIRSVRRGLYALQAVVRGPEKDAPVLAAGVAEVEVLTRPVDRLVLNLTPSARITGRFLFDGLEAPDPARTQIRIQPAGPDAHLRAGLATSTGWHADGSFEVEGIVGSHRLSAGSSGSWFIEAATLENGTEIAALPFAFEPGRTYKNVRVSLSDAMAEIQGPLPDGWDDVPSAIVAFPDEMLLWEAGASYVRPGVVSAETRRFSVKGLPPGHVYLVATYPLSERRFFPTPFQIPVELLERLAPGAAPVFVGAAATFQVTLPPPSRQP